MDEPWDQLLSERDDEPPRKRRLVEHVEQLQNLLIAHCTGAPQNDSYYKTLRDQLLAESSPVVQDHLPSFLQTCRNLDQFWARVSRPRFHTYAERREFLWGEFEPLLTALEQDASLPSDQVISQALTDFDSEHVREAWAKALARRRDDPEGAITMARSLLESVCKHLLDEGEIPFGTKDDLPKLYRQVGEMLRLAPNQHTLEPIRRILGGCTSVVEGLGTLRNRLSDSHGQGSAPVKPAPRHAELAVNLAGAMSLFLVATFEDRTDKSVAK